MIPKELRERAGLHPGSEVGFEIEGRRVIIELRAARRDLGGRFAGSGMAGRLLLDRARERR